MKRSFEKPNRFSKKYCTKVIFDFCELFLLKSVKQAVLLESGAAFSYIKFIFKGGI